LVVSLHFVLALLAFSVFLLYEFGHFVWWIIRR
jgi:hypothetical protein